MSVFDIIITAGGNATPFQFKSSALGVYARWAAPFIENGVTYLLPSSGTQGYKSTDGGINWTTFAISAGGWITPTRQTSTVLAAPSGTSGSNILVSTDNGATWVSHNYLYSGTVPTLLPLLTVGTTMYLITTNGGNLYTSTTLAQGAWTAFNPTGMTTPIGFFYYNSKFMIFTTDGLIHTTTTPTVNNSWSTTTNSLPVNLRSPYTWFNVNYVNNAFWLFGYYNSAPFNGIVTSTNGTTWTTINFPSIVSGVTITNLAWRFIAYGSVKINGAMYNTYMVTHVNSANGNSYYMYSTDNMATWTLKQFVGLPPEAYSNGVSYDSINKRFIASFTGLTTSATNLVYYTS